MVDDAELLRRYAQENAEPAFAELVQRHLDLVYSAALRRLAGDTHAAADVTQQVFTALAQQAHSLARGMVLPAWLYNTTRNIAVDFIRAEQRRRAREQDAHAMQQLATDSSAADWDRLRPLLDAAMDELPEPDREAVVLRYFARRPFAEIGEGLRVSEDAARMRVDRALEKLRVLLARRGVASTAVAISLTLAQQAVAAAPVGMAASVSGCALVAASTSSGAGSALTFFGFMNTSKIAVSAVGLLAAIACGGAFQEVQAQRAAEAALTVVESGRAALQEKLRELEKEIATVEEGARKKSRPEVSPPPARRPAPDLASMLASADRTFMARHPAVQNVLVTKMRAEAAGRFAPLFKSLRLSPAEIERFVALHTSGRAGNTTDPDGGMIAYDTGGNRRAAEEEMRGLLGQDGFDRYKEYERNGQSAWQQTIDLASSLYQTPTPLTPAQGERLWQILMANRGPVPWSSSPQYDWSVIMAEVRQALEPAQFLVFEKIQVRDQFSQALARTLHAQNNTAKNVSVPSAK